MSITPFSTLPFSPQFETIENVMEGFDDPFDFLHNFFSSIEQEFTPVLGAAALFIHKHAPLDVFLQKRCPLQTARLVIAGAIKELEQQKFGLLFPMLRLFEEKTAEEIAVIFSSNALEHHVDSIQEQTPINLIGQLSVFLVKNMKLSEENLFALKTSLTNSTENITELVLVHAILYIIERMQHLNGVEEMPDQFFYDLLQEQPFTEGVLTATRSFTETITQDDYISSILRFHTSIECMHHSFPTLTPCICTQMEEWLSDILKKEEIVEIEHMATMPFLSLEREVLPPTLYCSLTRWYLRGKYETFAHWVEFCDTVAHNLLPTLLSGSLDRDLLTHLIEDVDEGMQHHSPTMKIRLMSPPFPNELMDAVEKCSIFVEKLVEVCNLYDVDTSSLQLSLFQTLEKVSVNLLKLYRNPLSIIPGQDFPEAIKGKMRLLRFYLEEYLQHLLHLLRNSPILHTSYVLKGLEKEISSLHENEYHISSIAKANRYFVQNKIRQAEANPGTARQNRSGRRLVIKMFTSKEDN